MLRNRGLVFVVLTVSAVGCVPLSEPLSDVMKAEADEQLIGTWEVAEADVFGKKDPMVIDRPSVKGNPKGLMRVMRCTPQGQDWMFQTVIGKETYLNIILSENFEKEGVFAKWSKEAKRPVLVAHYRVEGHTLTLNTGDRGAFRALMKREGFDRPGPLVKVPPDYSPTSDPLYYPPAGWLAGYLAKNGPATLFPKDMNQPKDMIQVFHRIKQ